MNQVAAVQHEAWATLGFLRGVSSLPLSGQAFCTPQWVQLMMEVITGASPLNKQDPTGRSLLKQVHAMSCHIMCESVHYLFPKFDAPVSSCCHSEIPVRYSYLIHLPLGADSAFATSSSPLLEGGAEHDRTEEAGG